MESQPQNPEFRINPENFHPWMSDLMLNACASLNRKTESINKNV